MGLLLVNRNGIGPEQAKTEFEQMSKRPCAYGLLLAVAGPIQITKGPILFSFDKILTPGDGRRSRLHNARNTFIPLSRLVRNAPRAVYSWALLAFFGKRLTGPWISYDARAILDKKIGKSTTVLEFGSGMSTAWFAQRAKHVVSREDSPKWHAITSKSFADQGIRNVDLILCTEKADYSGSLLDDSAKFDFIFIDGRYRDSCAESAIRLLSPGGFMYLDNSDVTQFNSLDGDLDRAHALLSAHVKAHGGTVTEFVDFVPCLLFVTSGYLYELP